MDAGTGSGDRILEVAKSYKQSKITAIDFCTNSIKMAKMKAQQLYLSNINFFEEDILDLVSRQDKYDVIFAMGVLHHLESPEKGLRNLSGLLDQHGILFCYLYGSYGSADRIRQKKIVELLSHENPNDLDFKLNICKELHLIPKEYGWNYSGNIDESSLDTLIADCFFNVNETLYDYNDIFHLINNKDLSGFNIFGITCENTGSLVNLDIDELKNYSPMNFNSIRTSPLLRSIYNNLSISEKYRLMDMFYKPNGYTVICWKSNTVFDIDSFFDLRNSYVSVNK